MKNARTCRGCKKEKPLKEFPHNTWYCQACTQWYTKHNIERIRHTPDWNKYGKYGLTVESFIYNAF
jgi:hypothetical protein